MRRLFRIIYNVFINLQLRKKLFITYLLVLIVSMGIFAKYIIDAAQKNVCRNAEMAIASMVNNVSGIFELKMEQINNMVSICAFQRELQSVYRNQFNSYYDLYKGLNNVVVPLFQIVMDYCWGDVQQLTMYSTTGLKKFSHYIDNIEEISAEPWFDAAMERTGIWWDIQDQRIVGFCRVDSVQANVTPDIMGLLYTLLDIEFLNNYLTIDCPVYELSIYDKLNNKIYGNVFGNLGFIQESENIILRSFDWDAQNWTIEYCVPVEAMMGSNHDWLYMNLFVVLMGVFALLAGVFWITNALFRQIFHLKMQIQAVREGNLDLQISSRSKDEIGMLTNAFGEMVVSLKEQMEKTREAERHVGNLELRVLRAQIDPHFLYNTLSYINWLALRNDNDDIGYVVEQLSNFYRTCLNNGKELINVRQEMDNIKAYISIQLLMHSDSFAVEYDEDERLYEHQMLSFLLQPIVENAIVHGVDQRPEGGGRIRIATQLDGAVMRFCIQDDGPGFALGKDGQLAPIVEKSHGYGIANIEQRIHHFYGGEWGVRYANLPDGCVTIVEIPVC